MDTIPNASFVKILSQKVLGLLAKNCIHPGLRKLLYGFMGVKIGKGVFIGLDCFIDDQYPSMITIEDKVTISFRVTIVAHDEAKRRDTEKVAGYTDSKLSTVTPIHIKEGAYIGTGAILLPGITIGKGAVVGAGAVVTKSVNDYMIAVGNPAKEIRATDS